MRRGQWSPCGDRFISPRVSTGFSSRTQNSKTALTLGQPSDVLVREKKDRVIQLGNRAEHVDEFAVCRMIKPDVAFAYLVNELSGLVTPDGQSLPAHQELSLRVFVRDGGIWQVAPSTTP